MVEVIGKGGITVRIIKDSITPKGVRLRTFELEYHRILHGEFMTHRMLGKNASSTRAVPAATAIQQVLDNTAIPIFWGENNPGMKSKQEVDDLKKESAKATWLALRDAVVAFTRLMTDKNGLNLHKQIACRPLETFSFIKVVATGTELNNLFHLRDHADAQPEFRELAILMQEASDKSVPVQLKPGQWHLPYVDLIDGKYFVSGEEVDLETAKKVSASCCAQVSYRKLDDSIEKAVKIFDMLHLDDGSSDPAHASPTEHLATPMDDDNIPFNPNTWQPGVTHVRRDGSLWSGNLRGWVQYRQLFENQAVWG